MILKFEHLNDLGDLCRKHLICRIYGKAQQHHFFVMTNRIFLDSIKHISSQTSSVREVLPGRTYFIPQTMHKKNPLQTNDAEFAEAVFTKPMPLSKAVYTGYTGISPAVAEEICYEASVSSEKPANCLEENEQLHLYHIFSDCMEQIKSGQFAPNIFYENGEPKEFFSDSDGDVCGLYAV